MKVVSVKFKHSDDGFKYFIGYLHDDDVIRGAVHTQTATQSVSSMFVGGWVFKLGVFTWQFGAKFIFMQRTNKTKSK